MRINKYVAQATSLSRRAADEAIAAGRIQVNNRQPSSGQNVSQTDTVTLDGKPLTAAVKSLTVMLHKPAGYVVSRNGQGSKTIYELLPPQYQNLQPVGRLDKDSSGLLLLTNDGALANQLTHPRYAKQKIYLVSLDKPLEPLHQQMITDYGLVLADGRSQLQLQKLDGFGRQWQITMHEGRNRQIRRTFAALGYTVITLRRIEFGDYSLGMLESGRCQEI